MAKTSKKAAGGARKPGTRRRKDAEPGSRGLAPAELAGAAPPAEVARLTQLVAQDGGAVLGVYRDPLGGHWHVLAGLPLERVQPTPFQRDLSEAHVKRLSNVIDKLDRFLDPVIAVRTEQGVYWTPNGHHRTAAVRALGGRAIVALVLPDPRVAYQILALNTEKAHNLREKSLEVIRMARALATAGGMRERECAFEFEEPSYLTLGLCYEQRGRFAGGAYQPVLRRIDEFLDEPLPAALAVRAERARLVLELDEAVARAVTALRERGFESPYLRPFVVARINPLRFQRAAKASFEATIEKMIAAARRFDASKVRADQLTAAAGPPEAAE